MKIPFLVSGLTVLFFAQSVLAQTPQAAPNGQAALAEFFESKVNDVVMMNFLRRDFAAQFEPDPVQ